MFAVVKGKPHLPSKSFARIQKTDKLQKVMKLQSKTRGVQALMIFIIILNALHARAFSLLGPFEPWMTETNGFFPSDEDEIGGPMCISNGYRWNVPVVTYGFDPSFVNYFGTNGVAAVENAISILNKMPPASQMNATNYPVTTTRYNYSAQSQGLYDLQSETLSLLVEHLGLDSPDLGIYCLKDFWFTNDVPPYAFDGNIAGDVLQRNYDPSTDLPSDYIQNNFYSYKLVYYGSNTTPNAIVIPFGEVISSPSTVACDLQEMGTYFTGLTGDDIGGLRYLLSTNNVNYESLLPDVGAANGGTFVNGAWRPGVNKIIFLPQPADPVSGAFLPVTNLFTDTYITNGNVVQQQLERVTTQPDFLFCLSNFPSDWALFSRTGTTNWINNSALNGHSSSAGPGIIVPPVRIVFNELGQEWDSDSGLSEDSAIAGQYQRWGTFDGSTNPPITYPQSQTGAIPGNLRMILMNNMESQYNWQLSGASQAVFNFQTSTDLTDWVTLFAVTNNGTATTYINNAPSSSQRFYRISPQ